MIHSFETIHFGDWLSIIKICISLKHFFKSANLSVMTDCIVQYDKKDSMTSLYIWANWMSPWMNLRESFNWIEPNDFIHRKDSKFGHLNPKLYDFEFFSWCCLRVERKGCCPVLKRTSEKPWLTLIHVSQNLPQLSRTICKFFLVLTNSIKEKVSKLFWQVDSLIACFGALKHNSGWVLCVCVR